MALVALFVVKVPTAVLPLVKVTSLSVQMVSAEAQVAEARAGQQ
jgi:hypothetical protein